jgi:hypothetical protein
LTNSWYLSRDLRETKHRLEASASEVKKKEGQLKEMQMKMEQGDGCEFKRVKGG